MLLLNLLPPEKREKAKYRVFYMTAPRIFLWFFLGCVVLLISLKATQKILEKRFEDIIEKEKLIKQSSFDLSFKVQQFNKRLKKFKDIQNEFYPWSENIYKILADVPESGITISSVDINRTDKKVTISGVADIRDDFLKFKKMLESNGMIDDVNSPFGNILSSGPVNFSISAVLVGIGNK